MNYHITQVDTTAEGHLYVVVEFDNGLIEDFVFANLPATAMWIPTDKFGRWLTEDADQHQILDTDHVPKEVRRAIANFAADIGPKGYSGDRRDLNYVLGGPDHATKKAAMVLLGERGTL
jgi:hypothetical protein